MLHTESKGKKLLAEMFVYSTEAALIPDLLRIDEQELEQSHQSEPDILEPRQVSGRPINSASLACVYL